MKRLIILLVIVLSFTACQDILDCIINIGPELPDKKLKIGQVGEYYHDELRAGINNDTSDDSYDYFFTDSGELPQGLVMYYDYRTVVIEGTPETAGEYNIKLKLKVHYKYPYSEIDGDVVDGNLCFDETSKSYTLIIN